MSSKNRRRNGLHGTENLQMIQIKKHPLITRIVIIMSMEEGLEGGAGQFFLPESNIESLLIHVRRHVFDMMLLALT